MLSSAQPRMAAIHPDILEAERIGRINIMVAALGGVQDVLLADSQLFSAGQRFVKVLQAGLVALHLASGNHEFK